MMAVRLVSYVANPYIDERVPVAALLSEGGRVQVIRAPDPRVPDVAKANLEAILRDIEEAPRMDALPVGAGAHAVVGAVLPLNLSLADAPGLGAGCALWPSGLKRPEPGATPAGRTSTGTC